MKFRKRIIASVLAVVMTVTSLQFPVITVQAEDSVFLNSEFDTEDAETQKQKEQSDGAGMESEEDESDGGAGGYNGNGDTEPDVPEEPSDSTGKTLVEISADEPVDKVYDGSKYTYDGNVTVCVAAEDGNDAEDVTEQTDIICTYSGTLADGSSYDETEEAPSDAGTYTLTIAISDDDENYTGNGKKQMDFEIKPAQVTLTVKKVTLAKGEMESLPEYLPAEWYQVDGFIGEDKLEKELSYCLTNSPDENGEVVDDIDASPAGTYYIHIIPSDEYVGMNYEPEYSVGEFTLMESDTVDAIALSAEALSDTEVSVSWEVQEDVDGYYIYRSTANDAEETDSIEASIALTGEDLAGITSDGMITYTDKELTPGAIYTYSVATLFVKDDGTQEPGNQSKPIRIRTLPSETRIEKLADSEEGVMIQWSRADGADGYIVERRLEELSVDFSELAKIVIADSDEEESLTYRDTTASSKKTYTYRVTPYNEAVNKELQKGASAEEELAITTKQPEEKESVVISGIETPNKIYDGSAFVYTGAAIVKTEAEELDVTDKVELTYRYSKRGNDGALYDESDKAPVNAGSYTLTVSVDDKGYTGSAGYDFEITKAPVTVTANNVNYVIGVTTSLPTSYGYRVTGLVGEDDFVNKPVLALYDYDTNERVQQPDTSKVGIYRIVPSNAYAGENYEIKYEEGILAIVENTSSFIVIFNMGGHGKPVAPQTGLKAGDQIKEPETPVENGYRFDGWYKDKAYTQPWDFGTDTVQADTILFARWIRGGNGSGSDDEEIENGNGNMDIWVQGIRNQIYTGSAIKPSILVYAADGKTLLKSGRDYTISYKNNIDASNTGTDGLPLQGGVKGISGSGQNEILRFDTGFDAELPYIIIKGKGNYTGTIYKNFAIEKADISGDGITLHYTSGFVYSKTKAQKPFASIKYKKAMTVGKDYTVELSAYATEAYSGKDETGNGIPLTGRWISENAPNQNPTIPKGYYGTFTMKVRGTGNYSGVIEKTITVASDRNSLVKNASITLGSNLKQKAFEGKAITLISAYRVEGGRYYDNHENEHTKQDVFTVKLAGQYLKEGRDYKVSYQNNTAVGTATMTITGIGNTKQEGAVYCVGSKSVTFKITGTAFNAKNITVMTGGESSPDTYFKPSMTYTGMPITQDKVLLTNGYEKQDEKYREFVYGKDYTISYANNLKKGNATMTFTAKPESGYSGSFKKTFQITAAGLQNAAISVLDTQNDTVQIKTDGSYQFNGVVPYTKDGAKISDRVQLQYGNTDLKEGTDYTVKYQYNKAVSIGNISNEIPVMIVQGKGNYGGELRVNFTISKATISDLTISSTAVKFNAKKTDSSYAYQPKIKVMDGKKALSISADGSKECQVVYKNCTQDAVKKYLTALAEGKKAASLKPYAEIIINESAFYESNAKAPAKVYLEVYETKLTKQKLSVQISGDASQITYTGTQVRPDVKVFYAGNELEPDEDYTVTYGTNVTAGKNKGSITVTGKGLYGGSVTCKFTILSKDVSKDILKDVNASK